MKYLIIILAACFFLVSCGNNHYSPLDTYIKASNESYAANIKAEKEARRFIDSINLK